MSPNTTPIAPRIRARRLPCGWCAESWTVEWLVSLVMALVMCSATRSDPQRRLERLADDGFCVVAFGLHFFGHFQRFCGLVTELLERGDRLGQRIGGHRALARRR